MTMVATPGVIGVLQSSAPGSALTLTIDGAYAAYLAGLLTGTTWTYAKTRVGNSVEVMKITGISGQVITVTRAEDNTEPLGLAVGAQLEFIMGASAVADLITAAALAPALVLTGSGAVTVTENSTNNFTVGVPISAVTSNNASLLVTSAGPGQFDLAVNTSTIGCCTSGG
jgi:hypothetical protein